MTAGAEWTRYETALEGCKISLGAQALLIAAATESKESLPQKSKDRFSLGYILGFVDAWMQAFEVEDDSLRSTAATLVLQDLFGEEWNSCFAESLALMGRAESVFMDGMVRGGNDAFAKIGSGFQGQAGMPMTWAKYVCE